MTDVVNNVGTSFVPTEYVEQFCARIRTTVKVLELCLFEHG